MRADLQGQKRTASADGRHRQVQQQGSRAGPLAQASGEDGRNGHLCVLDGVEVLYLDKIESTRSVACPGAPGSEASRK